MERHTMSESVTSPAAEALPEVSQTTRPTVDYPDIVKKGLWSNNPALVQLLGLCPLLAVSGSVVNSLGLGLATLMVLTVSNITVSLIRNVVSDAVRLPDRKSTRLNSSHVKISYAV